MSEDDCSAHKSPRFGVASFKYCTFFDDESQFAETENSPGRKKIVFDFSGVKFDREADFAGAKFGGAAVYSGVKFGGAAWFHGVEFDGNSWFNGAEFEGAAWFDNVEVGGDAMFVDAKFSEIANFVGAGVGGIAAFVDAKFRGSAVFERVKFNKGAVFHRAKFGATAHFDEAEFGGPAWFNGAEFSDVATFVPLVANTFSVAGVSFAKRVILDVEAKNLSVRETRFESGAEIRVRYARVDVQRAFFGEPSSLSGAPAPLNVLGKVVAADQEQVGIWVAERNLAESAKSPGIRAAGFEVWIPQLLSVQETDVSQLTLADVDLRWCRFAGAHQLDKLRLEGRSPFNRPPGWQAGWAWPPVWRWSARRVVAEEHPWRAGRRRSGGWTKDLPDLEGVVEGPPVGPERLAVVYRSLRKAAEDSKNEAGAGSFYYGEMEARRHAPSIGLPERFLLTLYWLVSGYGQRASRALAALAVTVGALFVLLTAYGLPQGSGLQQVTGTVPAAVAERPQQVTLEVKPAPADLPPPDQRWTRDRMGKAIRIALGSVVFRDADQRLTPTGVWAVMAGRALGPLLLALAALAIRARVKR